MKKIEIEIPNEDVLNLIIAAAVIENVSIKEFIINSALMMSKLILNDVLNKEEDDRNKAV